MSKLTTLPMGELTALPEKSLLDENALAALFQVRQRTINRWVKIGHLPAPAVFGGRKIWMAGKFLAFIELRLTQAESLAARQAKAVNNAQTP